MRLRAETRSRIATVALLASERFSVTDMRRLVTRGAQQPDGSVKQWLRQARAVGLLHEPAASSDLQAAAYAQRRAEQAWHALHNTLARFVEANGGPNRSPADLRRLAERPPTILDAQATYHATLADALESSTVEPRPSAAEVEACRQRARDLKTRAREVRLDNLNRELDARARRPPAVRSGSDSALERAAAEWARLHGEHLEPVARLDVDHGKAIARGDATAGADRHAHRGWLDAA